MPYQENNLHNKLKQAIQEFKDYRDTHGGILLPTNTIVDGIYDDVMIEVGLRPQRKEIHILGKK